MNHAHMGNFRILLQYLSHPPRVRNPVIVFPIHGHLFSHSAGNFRHPFPIGPVGADQKLLLISQRASHHGFHSKGTASLHEHNRICFLRRMGKAEQLSPDFPGDLLIILIPGAVVKQHFSFYRIGRRQRSRRQQLVIWHNLLISARLFFCQKPECRAETGFCFRKPERFPAFSSESSAIIAF